jgi:hypothetical protein
VTNKDRIRQNKMTAPSDNLAGLYILRIDRCREIVVCMLCVLCFVQGAVTGE